MINLPTKHMILYKMIYLFRTTCGFTKMINLLNKTHDCIKKINLFSKTYDFIKIINLLITNGKEIISEKKKYFRWFAVSTCPPGQVRT